MNDAAGPPRETSMLGCRVALGGWYGAANLGDELILSVFVEWIRAAGGIPSVISVHPAYTGAVLGVDAASYVDLGEVVDCIAACDLFVLGGGGLFQNYDAFDRASLARFPARNVSQFAQYFYLARELGVPTAVLGQGVGPLHTADAREITADVFSFADACSVRDRESAQLLHTIGVQRLVPIAPDPAWAFARAPRPVDLAARYPQLAGKRVLAIAVRDWPFDAAWEQAFASALKDAIPEDWGCVWLDFSRTPSPDPSRVEGSEIAHRLVPRLGDRHVHVIWDGMRVEEACDLIAASDAMIAMRLHAALLGHFAGIPVVALEYDDKVRVLGDELEVPVSQRLPLPDIAARLPAAIRTACAANASPFRLHEAARSQYARAAFAHRDLLWGAMRRAMRGPKRAPRESRLLDTWLATTPEACDRVNAALSRRRLATRRPVA